ncbi:MAG: lysyl oxidase family protein [Actinomycetota bacterium]
MPVARRPLRPLALVVISLFSLSSLASFHASGAEVEATGSLRVVVAKHEVKLRHQRGGSVRLNLGAYIAATGEDFEIQVKRPDYDSPPAATQVDPTTKATLQSLPDDALDGWEGLRNFTVVAFRKDSGKLVARGRFNFCPNSWELQRTGDDSDELPSYPYSCGAWSPFTKGMVWGLNQGWAASALSQYGSGQMRVPEGHYSVTVRIAGKYRQMFGVSPEDATETLDVTVVGRNGHGDHGAEPGRASQRVGSYGPTRSVPTISDPDPSTVADLVALPTWNMRVRRSGGKDYVGFAVTPWNAGPAPLVVEGFRQPDADIMDAFQYFYDAQGNAIARAPVGTMEYDTRRGHHHWHFLQFAEFSMIDVSEEEVVRSKKQSFCLVPTDAIDLTVPRAMLREYGGGAFTQCGRPEALWVREVLPTGWGDTYYQSVGGQSFNITNLPNGFYKVRVEVNPTGELYETTTDNNVAERLIYLSGRPGARRLDVSPWHGIDA